MKYEKKEVHSEFLPVALGFIYPLGVQPSDLGLQVLVLEQHTVEEVGQLAVHHDQIHVRALAVVSS